MLIGSRLPHPRLPLLPRAHRAPRHRLGAGAGARLAAHAGPSSSLAEGVYTVTDPPLKALRKVIPAVTFGGLRIDFAFLVLMVVASVVMNLDPV